ncbi:hypothetical protein STCU_08256 [Strigomonas culicis]|uniref:Uncharacterized protein n=1 Tax=Strigomonas culicis TaxID=28005 RepID=S9V5S6_9TRYP|nr:hypothetical protein STCU_08256 [Strigomonas culicis]|eukprot:EPY22296.1 hypothetical protein STCU_08256 [Strigomonas culicis]
MRALMAENKELWQRLSQLQGEHDLVCSELALQRCHGGTVPRDTHEHVAQQLRATTERLEQAQQVAGALTALTREHEASMQALLQQGDEAAEELDELRRRLEAERAAGAAKTAALQEADAALGDATRQVEDLQAALQAERRRADDAIADIRQTNDTIAAEYDQRVRRLQADVAVSGERCGVAMQQLAESREAVERLQQALADSEERYDTYQQRSAAELAEQQQQHLAELERVRALLEAEVGGLRAALEEARAESRSAVRGRDEAAAKVQTLEAARRALESHLEQQREDGERQRQHLAEVVGQLRAASAELEEARAAQGEGGSYAKELQAAVERLARERDEGAARLAEEQQRSQQRCDQLQRDWKGAERGRAALLEEVQVLRARCAAAEAARQSAAHQQQDRDQLMQANLQLHERYQQVQEEARRLAEQLRALQSHQDAGSRLQQQLTELQARLRELPQLRQAADDARREMLKAREETELVRQERDKMAARLDVYLQDSKSAAAKDDEFGRIVRDASEAVKRLSGQVCTAKSRGRGGDHHVFSNTRATPTRGTGYAATNGGGGSSAPRVDAAAGPGVEVSERRDGGSAGQQTPQRPWRS